MTPETWHPIRFHPMVADRQLQSLLRFVKPRELPKPTANLAGVAVAHLKVAGLTWIWKKDPAETEPYVRGAVQAMTARWQLFGDPSTSVELEVWDERRTLSRVDVAGELDDPELWMLAWGLVWLTRDEARQEVLRGCALRTLPQTDSFVHPMARALPLVGVDDEAAVTEVREALTLTDSATDMQAPYVDLHFRQPLRALLAVLESDAAGLDAALRAGVTAHQQRFGSPDSPDRNDFRRLIAWKLAGIAALAHDRGLPVPWTSDYLPPFLITGPPPFRGVQGGLPPWSP